MERQSAARQSPIVGTVFPSAEQFSPKIEEKKKKSKKKKKEIDLDG